LCRVALVDALADARRVVDEPVAACIIKFCHRS
jgi:hypothetical protein